MIRTILDLLEWLAWGPIRRCVSLLPLRMLRPLIKPFSGMQALAARPRRTATAEELVACKLCDADKADETVRSVFRVQLNFQLKMCYLPRLSSANIEHMIPVEGMAHLDSALKAGSGAVIVNPHFGPFFFAMAALGHRGYKIHQVAGQGVKPPWKVSRLQEAVYRNKVDTIEKNLPANFINTAAGGMAVRQAVRALKRNETVFMPSTARVSEHWHTVSFLGRHARFSLDPFRLAILANAPLLPVLVIDAPPYARMVVGSPLHTREGVTAAELLEEYVCGLETAVRERPCHFGYFLCDMRMSAMRDDTPFFDDYPEPPGIKHHGRPA